MIVLLCGPSGVGKSYICDYFVENFHFIYPIPYTTRRRRSDEVDGKHYYFHSVESLRLLSNNFKRGYWVNLMGGNWYGYTDQLDVLLKGNGNIILHLQTGLLKRIKQNHPSAQCFFLNYLTMNIMEERIHDRTNSEEEYGKRLQFSLNEIRDGRFVQNKLYSDNPISFVLKIKEILDLD